MTSNHVSSARDDDEDQRYQLGGGKDGANLGAKLCAFAIHECVETCFLRVQETSLKLESEIFDSLIYILLLKLSDLQRKNICETHR